MVHDVLEHHDPTGPVQDVVDQGQRLALERREDAAVHVVAGEADEDVGVGDVHRRTRVR